MATDQFFHEPKWCGLEKVAQFCIRDAVEKLATSAGSSKLSETGDEVGVVLFVECSIR